MPRKKNVRVTNSRPRAKIPDGDEGKDLEADIKQAKLETLLKDFDDTVDQKLTEISNYGKTMIREIKTFHNVALLKIPKNIADMKLTEFLAIGGTVNRVKMRENEEIEVQMEAIVDSKKGQRTQKKAGNLGLDSIAEEDQENVGPAEMAKLRSREEPINQMNPLLNAPLKTRAGTSRKNAIAAQRNRNAVGYHCLETPMNKKMAQSGWETPLITPKFDPRLPFTPATMRRKKPGESVASMHMSLAGSPIATDKAELNLPLRTGNVLCLAADDDPSSFPLEQLDQITLQDLTKLHETISKIVDYHKGQK